MLFYAKAADKPKARIFTIYALLAKLSLEGFSEVPLNYHDLAPAAGPSAGGLGRFQVTCVAAQLWKPKSPSRKRKADEEAPAEKAPGDWDAKEALACVSDTSQIPNQYVKIVWYCDLATKPQPVVRLVQPALVWAQTLDFQENQVIQFA